VETYFSVVCSTSDRCFFMDILKSSRLLSLFRALYESESRLQTPALQIGINNPVFDNPVV
jgi:hypothetical protein